MTIQAHLDNLRERVGGCELTAFGDLSSRLILRSSSAEHWQRERLDQLCQRAVDSFAKADLIPASEMIDRTVCGRSAVLFTAGKSFIFVRPDVSSDEFTCAVSHATQDQVSALEATQDTARLIGDDTQ